jgi:hypothetical protein
MRFLWHQLSRKKVLIAQCPGSNPRITTLSPPGLDLSMSAAVQGPPPGLAPHGLPPPGQAMAALMGGPPPLLHLGSRPPPPPPPPPPQHLHRSLDPGEVPGPPNPDVLLALLSRNKTLEGTVLWKYTVEFLFVTLLPKYRKTIIRGGMSKLWSVTSG